MAPLHLPHSVSEKEKDVWRRIVAIRTRDVQRMDATTIETLLEDPVMTNVDKLPRTIDGGVEKFVWVLKRLIVIALDPTIAPPKRRDAYRDLRILLNRVKAITQSTLTNNSIQELSCIPPSGNGRLGVHESQTKLPVVATVPLEFAQGNPDVTTGPGNTVTIVATSSAPTSTTVNATTSNGTSTSTIGYSERVGDAKRRSPAPHSNSSEGQSLSNDTPISSLLSRPSSRSASHVIHAGTRQTTGTRAVLRTDPSASQASQLSHPVQNDHGLREPPSPSPRTSGSARRDAPARPSAGTARNRDPSIPVHRLMISQNKPPQSNVVPTPLDEGRNGNQNVIAPRQPSEDRREPSHLQASTKRNRWGERIAQPVCQSTVKSTIQSDPPGIRSVLAPILHTNTGSASTLATRGLPASLSLRVPSPPPISGAAVSGTSQTGSSSQTSTLPLVNYESKQRPARMEIPRIPTVPQPPQSVSHKKWFPTVQTRFTHALFAHPAGEFSWKHAILAETEVSAIVRRLYIWDPYWETVNILSLTRTAAIDCIAKVEKFNKKAGLPLVLHQAVEVRVEVPLQFQKMISGWGEKKKDVTQYKTGDLRLLLRMLPCQPPEKPTGAKKNVMRCDYHLWPKGTFLLVDNVPMDISQRKQQGHAHSEWSYTSSMLDVTMFVESPASITISAVFHDLEPFYLCVSVCRYRSPETLYNLLMNNSLQRLSCEESIQIAIMIAKKNTVCVIDDDVDHDTGSPSSFVFHLVCPITSSPITTPVRSRNCAHFQCFDLLNFLWSNERVSGTRWECPVCSRQIVSVFDLQLCLFTQMLIETMPSTRGIEFFSDGQWKKLPEKRRGGAKGLPSMDDILID